MLYWVRVISYALEFWARLSNVGADEQTLGLQVWIDFEFFSELFSRAQNNIMHNKKLCIS